MGNYISKYTGSEIDNILTQSKDIIDNPTWVEEIKINGEIKTPINGLVDLGNINGDPSGGGLTIEQATLLGTADELLTEAKTLPTAVNEVKSDVDRLGQEIGTKIVEQTDATVAIDPNCFNLWGEMSALTITLNTPADLTIYNEYMMQFTSGATATTLALPSSVKWMQEPSIGANKTYQISIVDNIAVIGGV